MNIKIRRVFRRDLNRKINSSFKNSNKYNRHRKKDGEYNDQNILIITSKIKAMIVRIKQFINYSIPVCSVGWGRRIHRQHFCRGVRSPLQRVS